MVIILGKYDHFRRMEGTGTAIRIAIVGPECTGKSDLANFLAQHFHTACVPEYARNYIDQLNRPYEKSDLIKIAQGQLWLEDERALKANEVLICDTNLLVIKIWSDFKYGDCPFEITDLMKERKYTLHLLTYVDIPWEADPQREHPDKREILFDLYKNELVKNNVAFVTIKGSQESRRKTAVQAIEKIMKESRSHHI